MTGERRSVTFRIPTELYDKLSKYSTETHRSMNAAAVVLFQQALSVDFDWLPVDRPKVSNEA